MPSSDADAPGGTTTGRVGGRLRRVWRGPEEDPAWARPALWLLLGATLALNLWRLSANGWANDFYSAAVQAGSSSWKAFLFGSSDASNSITVDKPPASLWPMALSVRLFGLNSWSILVPQALMGVGTVAVVYAAVKRWFGAGAGLIGGVVMALTPVAVLMFRYDNPDALLTLLMALAAWAALAAIKEDRLRWYVLCGVAVGFGFLTKQLQVLLVVPGFALALLVAGQGNWWRRTRGLLVAGAAMVLSAGWWVAVVELVPETWRPYIGGSQHNSFLELTFGYNGLGRITGSETGSVVPGGGAGGPGGGAGGSMWGQTGVGRMFGTDIGGQIAWLIPAALIALVVGLWLTGRRPRTDMQRASLIVWGAWLVVTALVFSFMSGIFHQYYTVALAPGIAALVGIGASMLWARRARWAAPATMAVATLVTTWWARELLGRATGWNPWLTTAITVGGTAATVALAAVAVVTATGRRVPTAAFGSAAGLALAVALAGPTAWSIATVSGSANGPIVTAGPAVAGARGPGGFGPGGFGGGPGAGGGFLGGGFPGGAPPAGAFPGGAPPTGAFPGGAPPTGAFPGGFPRAQSGQQGTNQQGTNQQGGGRPGGLLNASEPSKAVTTKLLKNADRFDWVAATVGAMNASGYQLAIEKPVMPVGGFNGSDPSPTLTQFKQYVNEGRIHWFIAGGMGPGGGGPGGVARNGGDQTGGSQSAGGRTNGSQTGGFPGGNQMGGSSASREIAAWVQDNFKAVTLDGVTMYDLTTPAGG